MRGAAIVVIPEWIAVDGLKLLAVPAAFLAIAVLAFRLRKEIPLVRTSAAEQLQAAKLLRSIGADDGSGAVHAYEQGLLHRILTKSRTLSIREVDFLFKLPDPYQHLDGLAATKGFFERRADFEAPTFRFARRYRRNGVLGLTGLPLRRISKCSMRVFVDPWPMPAIRWPPFTSLTRPCSHNRPYSRDELMALDLNWLRHQRLLAPDNALRPPAA